MLDKKGRPRVKYSTMSWKPSSGELGRHIGCVSVSDNTGVDSTEQRCFILDVQADSFNHTTNIAFDKPYFVDIPSPDQFVVCKILATCVVALYINSTEEVTDVQITQSFLDKYELGPIQTVIRNGVTMYQVDLYFEHSSHGKENICFKAKDIKGQESETVCIKSQIEPPDPCVSAPCKNSGTCERDKDTGGFRCLCLPKHSGPTCAITEDPCKPDPCVKGNSLMCIGQNNVLCWCNHGFTGPTCSENIDDCNATACNGRGSCKDKVNSYTCECFERFNGTNCEHDKCPLQSAGEMSCPADGCSPDQCKGQGVCFEGGVCACSSGFSGQRCELRKCNISETYADMEIITPSLKDGSKLICYTKGDTLLPCHIPVYFAIKTPTSVPGITIDTNEELRSLITTEAVQKSSVIPGISNLYTTSITIANGRLNSTKEHFVCINATTGTSSHSTCYELKFIANPEDDNSTLAYLQVGALVKFVQPTLKDSSRILCDKGEHCKILLYTSFSSNRTSCEIGSTGSAAGSAGSTGCDADDRDNDDDETAPLRANDPCCQNVISSTHGVTVYPAHPRGPSCVSEASFNFTSEGNSEICFQSAKSNFQQLCYKVGVYDAASDPCSSFPCQNNGHCFRENSNDFKCMCLDGYVGDRCERGPCPPSDNICQNDAYCQIDNGIKTCICKAGYSGLTCNQDPSSLHKAAAEFTDTAKPTIFECVKHQRCSIALLITSESNQKPTVSSGYVDPSLLLVEKIETVDRLSVPGSYQSNIRLKPLELGLKDICIQTKDTNGVNKDELCFKVDVISDVISIYGFQDRPHFVEPSLPTNTRVECPAGGPCHMLYHVTPGKGNENECVTFHPQPSDGFVNFHLFSSCDSCRPGDPSSGNCTVDVSLFNNNTDVNVQRHLCLSVGLMGSAIQGEERCFNLTVTDPAANRKQGCQLLECENGGFCDGHISSNPTCYCPKGYSGTKCEKAEVKNPLSGSQNETFIGDFVVPSEIRCVLNSPCYLPFQVITIPGLIPDISFGYVNPQVSVEKPKLKAVEHSSTAYEGKAVIDPTDVGAFKVCLQASMSSKTDDELCVTVDVISSVVEKVDQTNPFFLPPTITSGSTVLCAVNKACHFDMYYTKGDLFGSPGICPTLTETSPSPVKGVHIFEGKLETSDCKTDVSFVPPAADGEHTLCVQVALPGKKGENICYTVKIVTDIKQEVLSPCRGVSCENDGKCVADFNSTVPKSPCICKTGFIGNDCGRAVNKTTDLPGIENLNVTSRGNQHFDVNSAIPKSVICELNHDCCINTPYHGEKDKPPIFGFIDANLSMKSERVMKASISDPTSFISQLCINGTEGGPHRICRQTTTNGTKLGVNIDEMCFNVTIKPESKNHSMTGPQFKKSLPDGSTVTCKPNTVCHNPVITDKQADGNCSQPTECGDGKPGVYVFETNIIDDHCITDIAVNTGDSGSVDICIASGSRGKSEERQLKIEVNSQSSFGPCQKLHCLNGGSCMAEDIYDAVCHCIAGYTGPHCETDIDECNINHCQNNGTCIDRLNNYTCTCALGFTGRDCETDIDDCSPNNCLNNGTCNDGINNYTCTCLLGYSGHNCETDVDDCSPNNCLHNGTCIDGTNSYTCTCSLGYKGRDCEIDIDDCTMNQCLNNGTCIDGINNYTCTCASGYTGHDCGTDMDDCSPNQCLSNGTCNDGINNYTCTCASGYSGRNCEIDIDDCSPNQCLNNGTCNDGINNYTCTCALGYTGLDCESNIDDCSPNPCMNKGTCSDGIHNYTCTCASGYTGRNCGTDMDDCSPNQCLNNGTCNDGINNYTCTCASGYSGRNCEKDIDDCSTNNCQNGGACIDSINNYTCTCVAGYTGYDCETEIPTTTETPTTTTNQFSVSTTHTEETTSILMTTTAVLSTMSMTTAVTTTSVASTVAASSTSLTPNTPLCKCVHGHCALGRCICSQGWSGEACENSGGLRTHTGVQTTHDKSPPAFTEFLIPQIINCKINVMCTIMLPVDGKPYEKPTVEHGPYDQGLNVSVLIKVEKKQGFACHSSSSKCPYEAYVSVSPTELKLYKYCVQTKDYLQEQADKLCYQIQGILGESSPNVTSIFMYPPTLPENSTMSCSHNQTCHYTLEMKKKSGTCDPGLKVAPDTSSVLMFFVNDSTSNSCRYDVVYTPTMSTTGRQKLCFAPNTSPEQKHCMVVDVPDQCDTKKASEHAREMVTAGYASCFCIVNKKKVQIIKKRPVVQKQKLFKAVGFGAGGMVGTMAIGVVIYAVVNKVRQPVEKRNPPTPRTPPAASPRQRSRVHPN